MMVTIGTVHDLTAQHAATVSRLVETWEQQSFFIEAWSDLPGLLPNMPDDPWAESPNFPRLATKIPGLGNDTGTLELESSYMRAAAERDPDVADFAVRASNWRRYWFMALNEAEDDFFGVGCGWPPETQNAD